MVRSGTIGRTMKWCQWIAQVYCQIILKLYVEREREKEDQFEDQFGADLDRVRHFLQGKGKIGGGDIFNKDALEAKEAKKEDEDDSKNGT